MASLNRSVVDHPWLTIALFAVATAFFAVRIPELYIEPDVRTMMASDHPEFEFNDWMEEYFGVLDPALFMVINDGPHGVFTPETLALVQHLSEAMAEARSDRRRRSREPVGDPRHRRREDVLDVSALLRGGAGHPGRGDRDPRGRVREPHDAGIRGEPGRPRHPRHRGARTRASTRSSCTAISRRSRARRRSARSG